MKLVLPRIGVDLLRTTEDWSIRLEHENRNKSMFLHHEQPFQDYNRSMPALDTVIKAGALLTVDRYYLRKGGSKYDSITFMVHEIDGVKLKKKLRFWVNADIAQTLQFEFE